MWTADNTINVIRLILLGANVRKIQSFYIFFGKNFVNSVSERTRLGFFGKNFMVDMYEYARLWVFYNFFSNSMCELTRLSPNHSPVSESWGKSPHTHNWVVFTVLVVSSTE